MKRTLEHVQVVIDQSKRPFRSSHRINIAYEDDDETASKMKTCIDFMNKIRIRFEDDDHVYESFLDAMNMCRDDHTVIAKVYHEVAALFDDHPDLLEEFTTFLPKDETQKLKKQKEDTLFRCEDDRYEMDMLLSTLKSTVKCVEEFLVSINFNLESSIRIEDHFTPRNLRCIERIYGDYGSDVIGILRERPNRALPVILPRLRMKKKECKRVRSEFNKIWAEVYAKNRTALVAEMGEINS